ncbi:SUKH-4 family immunity protein [Streptomyces sp. NPDC048057]|uniref:SUKH-4 family immunity protein n=1 Tax=Streptomyces sp. NPDC048057 TaxID=3155628 RepID=UPI0033CEF642
MLFDIGHDELVGAVGASQVSRLSAADADRYGIHGEARDFLVTVGIPKSDSFYFWVEPFSPERLLSTDELIGQGWQLSVNVDGWLKLGSFPVTLVALAPDGVVHQLSEETQDMLATHSDLSSFVRTVVDVETFLQQYVPPADDDEAFHIRDSAMDAIQARVRSVDPLPFGSEYSEWHSIVDEIKDGSWV